MEEPRPHLQRYRDRQAHESIVSMLWVYPVIAAIVGVALVFRGLVYEQGREAVTLVSAGAVLLGLMWGILKAREWARRALVVLFSIGLAFNLARLVGAPGIEANPGDGAFHSLVAVAFLLQLAGAEGREQFAAARRFLAQRDLQRAEARASADGVE